MSVSTGLSQVKLSRQRYEIMVIGQVIVFKSLAVRGTKFPSVKLDIDISQCNRVIAMRQQPMFIKDSNYCSFQFINKL